MLSPTSGFNRVVRGSIVGVLCALLTAAGHSMGGGSVGIFGLVLIVAITSAAAITLTGTEMSAFKLGAFVASAQVVSHVMLAALAPHSQSAPAQVATAHHHGAIAHVDMAAMPASSMPAMNMTTGPALMIVGHVIVGLLIVWALRVGEALLFRISVALREVFAVLIGLGTPSPAIQLPAHGDQPTTPDFRPVRTLFGALLSERISRRGPPLGLALGTA
ncbi:MAG: hypothetical protein ACOYD0_10545 [Candidatus Nanopelagicales bacterium]